MRIGIFGGSFNPPHKMHKAIAKELIRKNYVDVIIIVPTGIKYHYKNNLLGNDIRYRLLQKMTKNEDKIMISTYEFQEKEVFTYETMEYFQEQYPSDELYFICGSDNMKYLREWKEWEILLQKYKLLVIPRNTNKLEEIKKEYKDYLDRIILTDIDEDDISSTAIRKALKDNDEELLNKYLDKAVLEDILKNHLYQS
jgi:nicotinate-nucleotide adenylyltransferase